MMEKTSHVWLANPPRDAILHAGSFLGHIIVILFIGALWVIVAFLVFMGAVGIAGWFKESPGAVVISFLVVGAVVTVVAGLFVSSWGIALLVGTGAGAVWLGVNGLHHNS
jgi:hypothetical protein